MVGTRHEMAAMVATVATVAMAAAVAMVARMHKTVTNLANGHRASVTAKATAPRTATALPAMAEKRRANPANPGPRVNPGSPKRSENHESHANPDRHGMNRKETH